MRERPRGGVGGRERPRVREVLRGRDESAVWCVWKCVMRVAVDALGVGGQSTGQGGPWRGHPGGPTPPTPHASRRANTITTTTTTAQTHLQEGNEAFLVLFVEQAPVRVHGIRHEEGILGDLPRPVHRLPLVVLARGAQGEVEELRDVPLARRFDDLCRAVLELWERVRWGFRRGNEKRDREANGEGDASVT